MVCYYEKNTSSNQFGKIIKFYLTDSNISVLLKKYKKKSLDGIGDFKNEKIYDKLNEFYCEIEETDNYFLANLENILSKCIVMKLKKNIIITTVVGKNNHD